MAQALVGRATAGEGIARCSIILKYSGHQFLQFLLDWLPVGTGIGFELQTL